MKSTVSFTAGAVVLAAVTAAIATVVLVAGNVAFAQDVVQAMPPEVVQWGMIAAALSAAASALGAAYAVAQVGSAAVGAIAEKPELLGRVLILVGLAEGIAIYGLIVAILILNRLG
ncbi:MAG: ATP synthase subunit C [Gammaproteobacteria bacterium]|nr:ATP synthase subunit C [Gammaproteobacteria bacterium]MBT8093392.1 ATP synthase subunit C [Gammaproteobacteria bacterium]